MSVGGFLKVFVYVSRKMLLSSASFPFSTILTINNCRWRVHVQYKLNKVCSKSWILKRCFPRDYKIKKRRITTTCFLNCSWVLLQFRLLQKLTSRSSNKCKKKNHVKGMSNPTRKAPPPSLLSRKWKEGTRTEKQGIERFFKRLPCCSWKSSTENGSWIFHYMPFTIFLFQLQVWKSFPKKSESLCVLLHLFLCSACNNTIMFQVQGGYSSTLFSTIVP